MNICRNEQKRKESEKTDEEGERGKKLEWKQKWSESISRDEMDSPLDKADKKKQVQKIKRREELDKKKSKEKKRNNSFRNMYIEGWNRLH